MDSGTIIQNAIGKMGRYQLFIVTILLLSRLSIIMHQLLVVVVSPPVGNFTCTDTSLSQCDEKCPGHHFDRSVWENTIDYEWDMVCSRSYLKSVVQSVVMLGVLLGNVSFGYLADRFGRHRPVAFGITLLVAAGTAAAFSPWLWLYMTLRFISTFALGGTLLPVFTILMELTDLKYRTPVAISFSIPGDIGHALLGPIAYYIRRWDHIQLAVSVPFAVLISYWCILPESPRWLLAVGRGERVIKILETGAKCNKLPTDHIRPQIEQFLSQKKDVEEEKGGNIVDLFRTKRMATKSLVLWLSWGIVSICYFGVAQYIGQIGGNVFLNIAISGLIQIPSSIIACFLIEKIGRKWCTITGFISIFVPMLTITLIPETLVWLTQTLACLGLMASSLTFTLLFVYTAELLPTLVRTLGLGLSSMFARMGAMIAPFIVYFAYWIPPLVFATLSLAAALSIFLFLPETKGRDLPTSVEEADTM